MVEQSNTPDNPSAHWGAFIHSSLDEYGLDPYQFRVYSHLVRRAFPKGTCYPKISTIASTTCMSDRKVQQVLHQLEDKGLIKREARLADHGGPTSDFITILGLAKASLGEPHSPPLVNGIHHPGAPGAYKGNPIKGNPFDIYEVNQKQAKTQRTCKLLESSTLPKEIVLSGFTPQTELLAWTLTRTYYQWHTYSQTQHAIGVCYKNFALAIQKNADFASRLQLYLEQLASLSPEDLENRIRNKQICPLASPPWVLVNHLEEAAPQSANPRLASQSAVIQRRNKRIAQTKTTDGPAEVQADSLVPKPDLVVLGDNHVESD